MKTTTEAPETATPELEYEWGVQYQTTDGLPVEWGFAVDPRTIGVVDEEGEIEILGFYWTVVAVGRRVKAPIVWEAV